MKRVTKNAAVVGACSLSLTFAYADEQFAAQPMDLTAPHAHYSAGTAVVLPFDGYAVAPPKGPVEPAHVLRELRAKS